MMKISLRTELPHWVIIAGMIVVAAITWSKAPDRIPVHWNLAGDVDRFGGKPEAVLAIPLTALGLYLLLLFLPRLDPGYANYRRFSVAYAVIRLSLTVLLAVVYTVVQLSAFGYSVNVGVVIPSAVGTLMVVLGSVMRRIQPNWFVGVRTPWTLSSRKSWEKTHRLAGPLFVLSGLLIIAAGFIGRISAFIAAGGLLLVSVMGLVVYSYLIWRKGTDRVPPAGGRAGRS